jgi:hypothetical protein
MAPVDAVDTLGWTALHEAAYSGATGTARAGVVQLLLNAGADVNAEAPDPKWEDHLVTPLHFAAVDGHTETVQLLLAVPELSIEVMASAFEAAVEANQGETAFQILRELKRQDIRAAAACLQAAAELSRGQLGRHTVLGLAEDMLTQWQEDEDAVQELKVSWLERMQQLLIGTAATHQQLQAAAGDNTVAAVTAAVQAAKQVVGETAGGVMGDTAVAAAAGAAFAAVAATAAVAPLAQDAAATAAAAAATGSGSAVGDTLTDGAAGRPNKRATRTAE